MSDLQTMMRALCDIPGVSGDEGGVRAFLIAQLQEHCTSLDIDALGNVIVFKKGRETPKNKLLFSAHMDEVGFIVTFVEDSGYLRFAPVGGIDSRVAVGKPVEVGGGRLPGIIGVKALHQASEKEREAPLAFDKLYIDIGAKDKEAALALVRPGDRVVFHSPWTEFGDGCVMTRALDDRAGCALLLDLVRADLPYDCYFAFTVQEEVGCIGASTVGFAVGADIAVAVETTTAGDIGGVAGDKVVCRLGEGPVLSFMDRGTIYDGELYAHAMELAEKENVRCQSKQGVYGGNESRELQTAGNGARVLAVSLPCRYIHSPSNMLKTGDIDETRRLLELLAGSLGNWEAPR